MSSPDPCPTWTMTSAELHAWLAPVLPHVAGPDHPALRVVRIESLGPHAVVAVGSDMYTMAVHRFKVDDPVTSFAVSLPAPALRAAVRVLLRGSSQHVLTLTAVTGTSLVVQCADADTSAYIGATDAVYLEWRSIVTTALSHLDRAEPLADVSVHPRLLARWRHLPAPVTIQRTHHSTILPSRRTLLIRHGLDFVGLHAPYPARGDGSSLADDWLPLLSDGVDDVVA